VVSSRDSAAGRLRTVASHRHRADAHAEDGKEAALSEGRFDLVRTVLGCRDFRVLLAARFASQIAEGAFMAAIFNAVVFLPE